MQYILPCMLDEPHPGFDSKEEDERLIGWMGERPQGLAAEEILELVPAEAKASSSTARAASPLSRSGKGKGSSTTPW